METTPRYSQLISQMAVAKGGLGIQHPRSNAIPMMILATKRLIQYAAEGIYLGPTVPQHKLPSTITNIYKNWKTSPSKIFRFSRKYQEDICNVCVSEQVDNHMYFFMEKSSLNTRRKKNQYISSGLAKATCPI